MRLEGIVVSSSKQQPKRDAKGLWLPGQSANPSGRPKQTPQERDFITLCKDNSDKAMEAVLEILADRKARPADRLRAAEFLSDRAFGKPVTRDVLVNLSGNDPAKMTDAQLLELIQAAENVTQIKTLEHKE